MFSFMQALQGVKGAKDMAGGDESASRLDEVVGRKGASMIKPSNKDIGMQFANAGLTPPPVPNMMNMVMGLQNLNPPGGAEKNPVFDIMKMLQGGGMR